VRKAGRFFHNRIVFYFLGFATWWTLIVPTSFSVYLLANNLSEIHSTTGNVSGDVFAASVVISMVAFLANYLGMWLYLIACDGAGWSNKIWWAVGFFFTAPVATIPYFFLVYRSHYSAGSRTRLNALVL
jgi:glucan phosphoethanolaminetransferase (alkaline phosphatase superfamily)